MAARRKTSKFNIIRAKTDKTITPDINANTDKLNEDFLLESRNIDTSSDETTKARQLPESHKKGVQKTVPKARPRSRSSVDGSEVRRSARKRKHTFQDSSTLYFIDSVEHDDLFEEVVADDETSEPPNKSVRLDNNLSEAILTRKSDDNNLSEAILTRESDDGFYNAQTNGMQPSIDSFSPSRDVEQCDDLPTPPNHMKQVVSSVTESTQNVNVKDVNLDLSRITAVHQGHLAESEQGCDEKPQSQHSPEISSSSGYFRNRESLLVMAGKLKAAEKRLFHKLYSQGKSEMSNTDSETANSDGIATRPVKRHLWTKGDTLNRMLAKARIRQDEEENHKGNASDAISESETPVLQPSTASHVDNVSNVWQIKGKELSPGNIPKKHRCFKCDYQTDNKSHLKRHENSVHNDTKEYYCYICYREFGRPEKIRSHMTKCHPEVPYNPSATRKRGTVTPKREVVIPVSPEQVRNGSFQENSGSVVKSLLIQKPATARDSPGKTPTKNPLKHTCPICYYTGKDAWHLKRHMSDVHNMDKEYKCPQCFYETSRKHRLISHMKNHGVLSCIYCPYTTEYVDIYQEHLKQCRLLYKSNQYFCTQCNGGFSSRHLYASHLKTYHGKSAAELDTLIQEAKPSRLTSGLGGSAENSFTDSSNVTDSAVGSNTDYYCGSCSQFFISLSDFETHIARYHSSGENAATAADN